MKRDLTQILTLLLTIGALFALTGWQITGETAATRLLGRLGVAMIEIDRWLPAHQEDLDLAARDRGDGVILVRDLPVEVTLPAAQVVGADQRYLRAAIAEQMGLQLYDNGNEAFRKSDGSAAKLSVTEPARWTVSLLSPRMHSLWTAVIALTFLLLLAAAASVMTTGETPVHAIATGAVVGVALAFGFWLLTQAMGSLTGSAADREIVLIMRDGAWTGVRDCGAVAFAAGVLGFLLRMARNQGRSPYVPAPTRSNSPFS
jgi:hypothetical protein